MRVLSFLRLTTGRCSETIIYSGKRGPTRRRRGVPYLIRAPRSWGAPESVTCQTPVGLQDIMPTILDACGLEVPETCTGRSLVPVLRGEVDGVRDLLHGEHSGCYAYEQGNHYVTDGRHKYILVHADGPRAPVRPG